MYGNLSYTLTSPGGNHEKGEIMTSAPLLFCHVHKKTQRNPLPPQGIKARDCVYLSVFIKDQWNR